MKLTQSIRSAFVRAAMNDVPTIDFDEMIVAIAQAAAVNLMPPKVRDTYQKHREWFRTSHIRVGNYGWIYLPLPDDTKLRGTAIERIDSLAEKKKAQEENLKALRQKLEAAAESCTTRKALAELLPEFEKYLPADNATAIKNLPAVANIVADFTKAGWPKNKAKPQTKRRA